MRLTRDEIAIRRATPSDIPTLQELIKNSVRELQKADYSQAQLNSAIRVVFGVDSQLIADGTYLVAETVDDEGRSVIIACGGWSKRKTLFGADQWAGREDSLLDPMRDAAKIRAFFVHPTWARRGVGTHLLDACEAAARASGFTRFEMGATLTGVKLFQSKGYVAQEQIEVQLEDGLTLPVVRMEKQT
jgi:N-acetylglutamate synthase-like GNAT family acetyltransferase